MEQYPSSASAIKKNCPVLSGKASSCTGCQYNGRKAYDCAQLTRYAAKAAGLELPSGASSQWKTGDWAQKGTIDTLPEHIPCFLYMERESANPMGHTGVYLGDGTVIDARGHSAGVVHRELSDVAWTHWAILNGQELTKPDISDKQEENTMKYVVTGNRLALRSKPNASASVLDRMNTGTVVDAVTVDNEWVKITYGGKVGYSMVKYMQAIEPIENEEPDDPEDDLSDSEKLDIIWSWYQSQK